MNTGIVGVDPVEIDFWRSLDIVGDIVERQKAVVDILRSGV